MPSHEPRTPPAIDKWVTEPVGRYSVWDDIVEQVIAQPGTEWARIERPDPWNSGFPTWFRKKYKDVELFVPPGAPAKEASPEAKRWMYMRRKPLAPSPTRKP